MQERQIRADVNDVFHSPGWKEVQRQILGNEVSSRDGRRVADYVKTLISNELDATVERAKTSTPNPKLA